MRRGRTRAEHVLVDRTLVGLGIALGPGEAELLVGEQHHAQRAPGSLLEVADQLRGRSHEPPPRRRRRAHRCRGPGVEVRAEQDHLVLVAAAGNLADHVADCASPSQREVLVRRRRTGWPVASCRSSMSASGFESASAGIAGRRSPRAVHPCGACAARGARRAHHHGHGAERAASAAPCRAGPRPCRSPSRPGTGPCGG